MNNNSEPERTDDSPGTSAATSQRPLRTITRRQVLGLMALTGANLMLPTGFANPREKRNSSIVRELKQQLEAGFAGNDIGFYFAYIAENPENSFEITIEQDRIYPVASAFKSGVALYYFMNTPQSEWQYGSGSDVYSMAVYSNNLSTGKVMSDVAKRLNHDNPLVAYNDFIMDPRMANLQFGLYQWTFDAFYAPTNGYIDPRFSPRQYAAKSMSKNAVNYSSAADLARLYYFLATAEQDPRWERDDHFRAAIEATREVLAIPAPEYVSPLERTIAYVPHFSKDGVLQAGEIDTRVLNDGGVWQVSDDGMYLIAFMSANVSTPRSDAALSNVADAIRAYQRYLHPNQFHVVMRPSEPVYKGEFNYGYVRETGVPLYSAPDLAAPKVNNPVRPTSIFGTTYLMYRALVRVQPVDDTWARIERDDSWDKTFEWPVYIQLKDLQIIDRNVANGIGSVTGQPDAGKVVVLDVYRRELVLFENATPVLRTPVILNTENTPRSVSVMQRAYLTRNMPNYPGVPFTYFLHGSPYLDRNGFAIHGSPWHLWDETVHQDTVIQRLTHGCINVPNWVIPIPHLGRKMATDEFVFRWAGGFPDPANERVYMHTSRNPVRVFSVNNIERELGDYALPDALRKASVYWSDVVSAYKQKEIDAPDTFFS